MKTVSIATLFLFFLFISCGDYRKPDPINKLAMDISTHISKKYNLIPIAIGGGEKEGKIDLVKVKFNFDGKPLNISEGRELMIMIVKDILNFINDNKEISASLSNNPFEFKNLHVAIFCHDLEGKLIFDPYLNTISAGCNEIGYFSIDPDNSLRFKKETYETYAEAFEKVKND